MDPSPFCVKCGAAKGRDPPSRSISATNGPTSTLSLGRTLERSHTGEVHWLILPKANVEVFSLALEHFAKEVGAGKKRRRILLVLDRAGWHTGKEVRVPEGIHLEFLPSHSPELQPAERLWPLSNEGVANRYFEELEELEEALIERCVALSDQPEIIRSYTRYHWWPKVA